MNDNVAPIIVKRVVQGGHGHHGGAWKVALADFVTAMMAFFMLLWILESTTKEEKAGISEYFKDPTTFTGSPTISILDIQSRSETLAPIELSNQRSSDDLRTESKTSERNATASEEENGSAEQAGALSLETVLERIKLAVTESSVMKEHADQIVVDTTIEGVRIQIVDDKERAMFNTGEAELNPHTKSVLSELAKVIQDTPQQISLSGHTDSMQFSAKGGYGNWELSADRANAARRQLLASGLSPNKITRVVGLADSNPFVPDDPLAPMNRRISITLLTSEAEELIRVSEGAGVTVQKK